MNSLNHDIILRTNLLKQINFNKSEKDLQFSGKRGMKEVTVNYVTICPQVTSDRKKTQKFKFHMSAMQHYSAPRNYTTLRSEIQDIHMTGKFASPAYSVRKNSLAKTH